MRVTMTRLAPRATGVPSIARSDETAPRPARVESTVARPKACCAVSRLRYMGFARTSPMGMPRLRIAAPIPRAC